MRRVAAAVVVLAAVAVTALVVWRSVDDEHVESATVPGVGRIDGTLPAGVANPPPRPRKPERGLGWTHGLAYRGTRGARDAGSEAERAAVRTALARHLFLIAVVDSCVTRRDAALLVYRHVFVPPARDPQLYNLAIQPAGGCVPTRLRVDEWEAVEAEGAEARAVVRGAEERHDRGAWRPVRLRWRALLRRDAADWKVAALQVEDLENYD